MKKSKVFMAAGALALAIAAVFASKANKKFVTITSAYGTNGFSYSFSVRNQTIFTTSFSTWPSSQVWAELCTASGGVVVSPIQLFTDQRASGNIPLAYK